jgi:hypothetical protein
MQAKGPAATPPVVRAALGANIVLVVIALMWPHTATSDHNGKGGSISGDATLFAVPMVLILVIGIFAAIQAFILARREDRRVSWVAFAPLGMFFVGLLATVLLVYTEII